MCIIIRMLRNDCLADVTVEERIVIHASSKTNPAIFVFIFYLNCLTYTALGLELIWISLG